MHKQEKIHYGIFLVVLLFDFVSKHVVAQLYGTNFFNLIHFVHTENHGFMLGLLQQIPDAVKLLFLTTVGVSLSSLYIFLISFAHLSSPQFKLALTFIFSGAVANMLDRIVYGRVLDFLAFNFTSLVLNFADIVQLIGLILLLFSAKKEIDASLPKEEKRHSFTTVYGEFKRKFLKDFFVLFSFLSLIILILNVIFIKYTLEEHSHLLQQTSYLFTYIIIIGFFHLLLLAALYFVAKKMAQHIYGPIHALERSIDELLRDSQTSVNLRKGDHFKQLAQKLTQLQEKIEK